MCLINVWIERLHMAQCGHYATCEKLYFYGKWNGFLLLSLTISMALLTFYNINDLDVFYLNNYYKGIFAVLSAASAFSSSYHTMYRPNERAEIHRAQAAAYGALKRKLELSNRLGEVSKKDEVLKEVQYKWDIIASNSPLTKKSIIKKCRKCLANKN